jgi:hypothetical protein
LGQPGTYFLYRAKIAVTDDRDRNGFSDMCDLVPVGRIGVSLLFGPTVHCKRADPALFKDTCGLHRINRGGIPTEPNFGGDRDRIKCPNDVGANFL